MTLINYSIECISRKQTFITTSSFLNKSLQNSESSNAPCFCKSIGNFISEVTSSTWSLHGKGKDGKLFYLLLKCIENMSIAICYQYFLLVFLYVHVLYFYRYGHSIVLCSYKIFLITLTFQYRFFFRITAVNFVTEEVVLFAIDTDL